MIKRVKLNSDGYLTEIDMKPVRRLAQELKNYIENCSREEAEKYEYQKRMMPLINSVLDGTLPVPNYLSPNPYSVRYMMEGLFPELVPEFGELYYPFMTMTDGDPMKFSLSTHETGKYEHGKYRETDPDGTQYELCWFED